MKTGIIAFCGSKGAGKDTSFNIFSEISGLETEQIALAGHLKEVASEVFGVDMKYFTQPELKEVELEDYVVLNRDTIKVVLNKFYVESYDEIANVNPHVGKVCKTPRYLLQYIGTEVLHPIDPLIHVKIAMKKQTEGKLTVITDLRFETEFTYLFENATEFTPVYVKNSKAEIAASVDAHPSETQLHNFKHKCYLLNNEGDLNDLRANIETLVNNVYKKETNNASI